MQKAVYLLLFLIAGTIAIAQVSSKSPVNTDAAVSPLVNRNGRIIGMWRPHPTIADTWWPDKEGRLTQEQLGLPKSNPHADHWRLSFNADGTAAFTGKEFYLGSDPPQTADAEMTTDDWLARDFNVRGNWDFADNSLSIVTEQPSINTWHVVAVTERHLVLRQQTGIKSMVGGQEVPETIDMFWIRE